MTNPIARCVGCASSLAVALARPSAAMAGASTAPPQFEVVAVNGPVPYTHAWLMDLNGQGQAVGYASAAAPALYPSRAYRWEDGVSIDLGDLGELFTFAEAINDAGAVVGWAEIAPAVFRGFLWDGGPMVQLPGFARAIDIDSQGRILGVTLSGGGAMLENGVYTDFPAMLGGHVFAPAAMNDNGQVVGRGISTLDDREHAFLFDNGAYTDLGMAPGDDWDSEAIAINRHGVILGMSRSLGKTAITSRMVIWEDGRIARIVDPLPGDDVFIAMDINDAGDAVGMSGWPQTPVLWTDGKLHDLNALLAPGSSGVFFIANAINNQGWIAVDGQFGCCGYVLRPLPLCPSDISADGEVDVNDLLAVISSWGPCPAPPVPCNTDIAPGSGDGSVGVADLLAVISAWGPCP